MAKEFTTSTKTRLDVAIDGPRKTGIEIQRSFIKSRVLTTRTTKSFSAGWLPIWFTASDKRPDWFNKVPTMGCNPLPWGDHLPGRRAATAMGITKWNPVKCRPGEFDRCPSRKKRACGAWHPKRAPRGGLTVDDVATQTRTCTSYSPRTSMCGKSSPAAPVSTAPEPRLLRHASHDQLRPALAQHTIRTHRWCANADKRCTP